MSWLFSQALVAEYSAATCSDGGQSAPSSWSPTPQAYCAPDKMTAFSRLSRFGMTFAPLTDDRGADLLTWYLAGFLAKTSVSQEPAQALTVSGLASGEKWPTSLAKYDRDSHSLKTAQLSLLGDSIEFSATLPRSGTMRNGECYQRPTLERPMSEKDSGLWPTPTASAMPCEGTVRLCRQKWLDGDATLEEASAIAGRDVRKAQWKVLMWPTPVATMARGWSPGHNRAETDDRIDYTIEREARRSGTPGRLNPEWVEWLMGWPVGHTDLKPLETAKFHEWQRQHSPCYDSEQAGKSAHAYQEAEPGEGHE